MEYIKVVCVDMMCCRVDKETLEALCTSYYDPYAWLDPEPVETITHAEWIRRKHG